MARINKYDYVWVIQGYYDSYYGWEDLCIETNWKEKNVNLKAYREAEPHIPIKCIQRRVLNPEFKEALPHG